MRVFLFIYTVLSAIVAIGVIACVCIDVVIEKRRIRAENAPVEPEIVPNEPEVIPTELEIVPEEPEAIPTEPEIVPEEPEAIPTEPEIVPEEPEAIPTEPEVMPEPIEEVDVESADMLISDELAMSAVSYERGATSGFRGIANIGDIDAAFEHGDTVTLDALKEKGLLPHRAQRVKILADGILRKPLTVKAEAFSVQAVKMIELTGGTVVILQD